MYLNVYRYFVLTINILQLRATGFITMKIGKITACAVGGGIIMLQIAAHQGYIRINWDKIIKKAEKITDKVEEKITGEGPSFKDKVDAKIIFFCIRGTLQASLVLKQKFVL